MLRLAYNEVIQKHSDISASLADMNLHFAGRIKAWAGRRFTVFQ